MRNDTLYKVELLERILVGNHEALSILEELRDDILYLVELDEIVNDRENEIMKLEDKENELIAHIDNMKRDTETLFERWDDGNDVHDLMDKVAEVLDKPIKYSRNNEEDKEDALFNEIEDMMKRGYVFGGKLGEEVASKIAAKLDAERKEAEESQRKKELEKQTKQLLKEHGMYRVDISKLKDNVYSFDGYNVSALIDLNSNKVSGKGSRSNREAILNILDFYIQNDLVAV